MRLRSTGLGETELQANVDTVERKDGHMILHMRSTEPVVWHIRGAVGFKEAWGIIMTLLKRGAVQYVLFGWARKGEKLAEF